MSKVFQIPPSQWEWVYYETLRYLGADIEQMCSLASETSKSEVKIQAMKQWVATLVDKKKKKVGFCVWGLFIIHSIQRAMLSSHGM